MNAHAPKQHPTSREAVVTIANGRRLFAIWRVAVRSRLRPAVLLALALLVVGTPAAGATATGTITSSGRWVKVATLARGVTLSRRWVTVSGYAGKRDLTRVSWPLGDRHVRLDATPVVASHYSGVYQSFAEGKISSLGASVRALAGINGDTYCQRCARNGGDTLHGLLVRKRQIYASGAGPEVGYLPGGRMIMGSARAVPVRIMLPGASATIAVWNAFSIPGKSIAADQVAVLSRRRATFTIPATSTALILAGSITANGQATTVGAQFRRMLEMAVPYADSHTEVAGSSVASEWANAFRISQTSGTGVTVGMPVSGGLISGAPVTVPTNGVVLVARNGTIAANALQVAATHATIPVTLDDAGWNPATNIMDGKFRMVDNGVAETTYPGWSESWPWYCQGVGSGCVRAATATTPKQGWLIVEAAGTSGLTMPDFALVLKQLGATNAMAFDSNTHSDFWARGHTPISGNGSEPAVPAATLLSYH
jgi:hypothetical protein